MQRMRMETGVLELCNWDMIFSKEGLCFIVGFCSFSGRPRGSGTVGICSKVVERNEVGLVTMGRGGLETFEEYLVHVDMAIPVRK